MRYKKHIFICTNQRNDGRRCCGEEHGLKLVAEMKRLLKEKGINKEIRAQRAGCLDACDYGPSMVVYPEGVFYGKVQLGDIEQIVNEHLINNNIVERLVTNFEKEQANSSSNL